MAYLSCHPELPVDCDGNVLFKSFSSKSPTNNKDHLEIIGDVNGDKQAFIRHCAKTDKYPKLWVFCTSHAKTAERAKDIPTALCVLTPSAIASRFY